jgi:pimeloyl-ACP methyl ester carboxylesterase
MNPTFHPAAASPARALRQPRWLRASGWLAAAAAAFMLHAPAAADDDTVLREAAQLADRVVQPTLQFAPCAVNATLDCATLRVPVDYRKPWVGHVDLAVIRARATQPSRRIGVLYANPGGPGGSGFDFVRTGVNSPAFIRLRERFDIVSFDVRGTHRSQAVQCEAPFPPTDTPQAIDTFSEQLVKNCLAQHGALITSMSTNNNARDIDVLRRSLGERQLTLFGLSHGTALGAVYATLFPRHVRAMLLDAGHYPNFHDGLVEFSVDQAMSFEFVFQHLDQRCRADAVCRLRTVGVANTLAALSAFLQQTPVAGPGGVLLTAGGVQGVLSGLLPRESAWPLIVDALADARAGNFALLFQLAAAGGGESTGSPGMLTMSPLSIIRCNDFGTRRKSAEVKAIADAQGAVSSRITGSFGTRAVAARCAAWPEADVPLIRPLARGWAKHPNLAVPTLLLTANFDPNTPTSWTRNLADRLGAEDNVVRYEGAGHGIYAQTGNTCIDALGDAFLFELKMPASGTRCAARPIAFRPEAGPTTEAMARARVQALPQAPVFETPGLR